MANELTNIFGRTVRVRTPHGILADLVDRKQQHKFRNAITGDQNRASFVIDHNTGISICRDETQSEITYCVCGDSEIARVPNKDALLACELFWDLVQENQVAEPTVGTKRRRKKKDSHPKRKTRDREIVKEKTKEKIPDDVGG